MFIAKTSITLLSVLLGSTLIQTSLQQSAIWCEPLPAGTDPSDVACPAIYDPVCAYMKGVPLGVTVSNECVACDQEEYDYYYPGECQGVSQEEEEEEEGNNQEESSEGCVDEEGSNQEEEEGASQEEEEEEGASQEEEEEGNNQEEEEESDNQKYKCIRPSNPTQVLCIQIYEPVCAYHYGDDEGTTVGNQCTACLQQDYDYYTNGECENQEEDGNNQEEDEEEEENDEEEGDNQEEEEEEENDEEEGDNQEEEEEEENDEEEGDNQEEEEEEENDDKKYKCVRPSNPDDVVCGLIYQPVCAYNYGDDEGTTVGNRCTACEQQDYDYYTNGAC